MQANKYLSRFLCFFQLFIIIFILGLFFPKYIIATGPCSCCPGCSDCVQSADNTYSNPNACSDGWIYTCASNDCPGGCFLAGTKIRTPDGEKNIEDIKVGDVVLSYGSEGSPYEIPTAEYIRRLGATKTVPKRTLKEKALRLFRQTTASITDIAKEAQDFHYRMFVE